jgi:hypothetical protein
LREGDLNEVGFMGGKDSNSRNDSKKHPKIPAAGSNKQQQPTVPTATHSIKP